MRKLTVSLIAIIIITGTIFAGDLYTKKLNLEPKSSERFSRNFAEEMTGTVQLAGLDLGSGRIIAEVYDPNGKKVAGGSKEFSFNTKNIKGKYKIVVINRTNKIQTVEVSVNTSES
jgi:hypothetical protein